MFKLSSKLAFSNLKQNRKLYYPFALAVILTTMILYKQIFRGEKTERKMFQEISDTLTVMAGKEDRDV